MVHKVQTSRDHFQGGDLAWMVATLCELAVASRGDEGRRSVSGQERASLRDLARCFWEKTKEEAPPGGDAADARDDDGAAGAATGDAAKVTAALASLEPAD
uniref:Uncharacterized protein n=1 Tax=Chloropicon laureae TaxID=464258 RepID=A0A7S2Z4C5_9CHLO|mmetsp:Transcript_4479/g.11302  ORF Transcript_4479/g.11302 Transcript_4479/m.11302 type:complete len:101 (+) Transcript_4479:86-388(+)